MLSRQILKISWNIATEPKLYWELAQNPYSILATRIISEKFPRIDAVDVIRAVAWAEPEGGYDRGFRLLEPKLRKAELRKQKAVSVEINKRLAQFGRKHMKQFSQLPKESVYNGLISIAFGTTDLTEIGQRFSQNQRRDFKLTIIDLIENPRGFTAAIAMLLVVLFIGSSLGLSGLVGGQNPKAVDYSEVKQEEGKAFPVRLKIPSIKVDANIQLVGIGRNGEMEVAKDISGVGWYAFGPRPGEKGSAVLAGHFNGENGTAGVFADLNKLKKDDKLYIEDGEGTLTTFVVRESRTYDPGFADEVFSRNDGSYLNLVTCEGLWDEKKQSYSERLVVFADIEN